MKTKFKVISFALVILLSLTGFPSDIVAADNNGEILRDLGILKGDLSGDLLLDQPLKRQDVIVLLSRLLGVEDLAENFPGNHTFTDVTDPYYDSFIAWAEDSELTEGIGGGLFGFNQYLNNQQLLAFLLRALGHEFFGDEYSLVPDKAVELEISPSDEAWGETTTRQLMADRTVALLRHGRVKYSNITLERALVLSDDSMPSNGQLFQLDDFNYKKGSVLLTFSSRAQDHNGSRSNTTASKALEKGPDIEDIELTYKVLGTGHVVLIKLTQVFYDSATGQFLATYDQPSIPDGSNIELTATYLENRNRVVANANDLILRKRPGRTKSYEPSEALLMLEEILRDLLPPFSGSFSSDEFKNDELKQLSSASDNPLYEQNSLSGENPLFSRVDSFFDIYYEISVLDNVVTPDPDNLFIYLLLDGELLECDDCLTIETDGRKFKVEIKGLSSPEGTELKLVAGYIKIGDIKGNATLRHNITDDEFNEILDALILNLHLSTKPDSLTAVNTFGRLTLNLESYRVRPLDGKNEVGVIVGTELTNPELTNEIIVAMNDEEGNIVLKTFKVHDYGDEFIDEFSAYNYFLRYLDEDSDGDGLDADSDGDGLDDLVFKHKHKPINVTKPVDKATPLLMVTDGGLGDHVTLYLENGEVMYWSDGIDNDCDGTDDGLCTTTTSIDTITFDSDLSILRTGRNPQTGKEIQIAAKTVIVVTGEDGSLTTYSPETFKEEVREEVSFAYAKVTSDGTGTAVLIHIIQNAKVVYKEIRELDKSSTKILWTNIDDLTEEETNFLLSDEADAEMYVFRQEFGPVQASSYRFWNNRKLAEEVTYILKGTDAKKVARFKAGKALADTVKSAGGGGGGGRIIIIGEAPNMAVHLKFDEIVGEAKAVMVVDSFFDIFTELSVDFRGHVTVLK